MSHDRTTVRSLRLRDEPSAADHLVVIRGGVLEGRPDDQLRQRAHQSEAIIGLLAQSVLLAEPEDVSRICRHDGRVSRYNQVNLSTVARVQHAVFPLAPTLDAPHYSVVFADLNAATIQRFRSCFGPAQPSPPAALPE